jgi:hypothetical protein
MLPPVFAILADHVLELVRGMGYNVGVTRINRIGIGDVWHLDARNAAGETWIAGDEDHYRAAVLLARFVGAKLEE